MLIAKKTDICSAMGMIITNAVDIEMERFDLLQNKIKERLFTGETSFRCLVTTVAQNHDLNSN